MIRVSDSALRCAAGIAIWADLRACRAGGSWADRAEISICLNRNL